jgi:hypothetical protein
MRKAEPLAPLTPGVVPDRGASDGRKNMASFKKGRRFGSLANICKFPRWEIMERLFLSFACQALAVPCSAIGPPEHLSC